MPCYKWKVTAVIFEGPRVQSSSKPSQRQPIQCTIVHGISVDQLKYIIQTSILKWYKIAIANIPYDY